MGTKFPIFKPRYPLRTRLFILLPTVLFFGLLCRAIVILVHFPMIFWLLMFASGLFTSLLPFFFIREIRFPGEMIVRRYFLPDYFFSYKEFEQINPDSIQAGGKNIRMGQIINLDELKGITGSWKAAEILKGTQHKVPETKSLFFQRGYGTYASFWGLIFGIVVMLTDLPWLQFDPRWVLGGTFLLVYFTYIYIIPKYL